MTRFLFINSIWILAFGLFGCASEYKLIEPTKIEYFHEYQQLDCTAIFITYRYNILRESGNHIYADNEDQSRISLIAILIDNQSKDTFNFPEDIMIFSETYVLEPLELKEVKSALMQRKSSNEDIEFEIETKKGTLFLGTGLFDDLRLIKENNKFYKELNEYYLPNSIILPGTKVSGLLALPSPKYKPLTFNLAY